MKVMERAVEQRPSGTEHLDQTIPEADLPAARLLHLISCLNQFGFGFQSLTQKVHHQRLNKTLTLARNSEV